MPSLPMELIFLIATYLAPLDQVSLLQAVPGIAGLFTSRQFTSTDDKGNTILHLQARACTTPERAFYRLGIPFFPSILAPHEGAILHPRNHAGATPLMLAARAHNLRFMQLLLKKDPEGLNLLDENGLNALWYAISYAEGLALLLEQPLIEFRHCNLGQGRESPVFHALNSGYGPYDICSLLAKHPATHLSEVNEDGQTALMVACRGDEEQEQLVRDILDRGGFDINATDPHGNTALHFAAWYNSPEIIEMLVAQEGIEVNLPDNGGRTPLMKATYDWALEALLARKDVDVNWTDHDGRSALSHIARRGIEESARVLLAHGARPDLQDFSGYTPISRAAMAMKGDMVEILEAALAETGDLATLAPTERLLGRDVDYL
ncbi:ankyrin repeat-containing domain protein [Aspergillus karnatakaensis]|uniref:ankyrin repeat domain-containing protein n=1 Tax=Aspergillus karnatakaensis TaxID=1810916 RepID=UPI003CCD86D3